jgi:hypothetical protein
MRFIMRFLVFVFVLNLSLNIVESLLAILSAGGLNVKIVIHVSYRRLFTAIEIKIFDHINTATSLGLVSAR